MSGNKAVLLLEDGATFEGLPFGQVGSALGETVFYTGVVGYQELLTNPSYGGTLAVLTYPIIGSYGVNGEDNESAAVRVSGLVIREYSRTYSNWRATGSLDDFLAERGIVGIREVDTRALTVHLREHGEMRGVVASGDFDPKELARRVRETPSPFGAYLVRGMSRAEVRPAPGVERGRVILLDLGVKRSLLDQLAALSVTVELMPSTADADAILAKRPQRVLVAGGPGDPRVQEGAIGTVRRLLGKTPLLGIGLGHQVLALALGCQVARMRIGHHGVNYPVRDPRDGSGQITVQHHSFVVSDDGLACGVEVTHRNLNDQSIEGLRCREIEASSVQFHPIPDEQEQPSDILATFCGLGGPHA